MSKFSTFLFKYMTNENVSITDMSNVVEVSEITVNKWLKGYQYPSPKHIFKLSLATGLTTSEIARMVLDPDEYACQLSYMLDLTAYAYGMSRTQLSRVLGIGVATMAHWKKDICVPSVDNMSKLYKAFGWEPVYIEQLGLNTKCSEINMYAVTRAVGCLVVYCVGR